MVHEPPSREINTFLRRAVSERQSHEEVVEVVTKKRTETALGKHRNSASLMNNYSFIGSR